MRSTKRNKTKPTCRRYLNAGTLTATVAAAGQGALMFPGRLNGRPLKAGPYRVTAYVSDLAGNRSRLLSTKFAILR